MFVTRKFPGTHGRTPQEDRPNASVSTPVPDFVETAKSPEDDTACRRCSRPVERFVAKPRFGDGSREGQRVRRPSPDPDPVLAAVSVMGPAKLLSSTGVLDSLRRRPRPFPFMLTASVVL